MDRNVAQMFYGACFYVTHTFPYRSFRELDNKPNDSGLLLFVCLYIAFQFDTFLVGVTFQTFDHPPNLLFVLEKKNWKSIRMVECTLP